MNRNSVFTTGHTMTGHDDIIIPGTDSCMSVRPVIIEKQTIKAADYMNTLEKQLHPYIV